MDWRGEYQDLPSIIFRLTVQKRFVGERFCAVFQKNFGSEFFMDKRGGGIRICRRFFLSQRPEKSTGNPSVLCFRKLLVAKKFMHKRGVVSGSSVDNFLSYSAEKIRRGTLLCFTDFPVSKKFMEKRGGTRICRRKVFVTQCRKIRRGIH